jgi:hypothetical protein
MGANRDQLQVDIHNYTNIQPFFWRSLFDHEYTIQR